MSRTMKMLSPLATPGRKQSRLAPRVVNLDGKVVGFLRNEWPSLLVTMNSFEEQLKEKDHVFGFVWKAKVGIRGTPPEDLDELARRCDVVVNGLGS
ncbi:MAG: hypothetical protein HYX92_08290 [Chloroflexi bacterium]|nr:hypothetical protein [Chloroflexota bacterium]